MELGLGNSLFKNRVLTLFPLKDLQHQITMQTYEETTPASSESLNPNDTDCTVFEQIDTETPPDTLIASESSVEISSTELNTVSTDDSNHHLSSSVTNYASHRVKIKLTETNPDEIVLSAKGYGAGGGADEGWKMFIWNFTTETWGTELDSHTNDVSTELTATINTDVSDYIDDDGYVQVLLSAYTGTELAGSTSKLYYFGLTANVTETKIGR